MADDRETGEYASPPCFLHELDPSYRTEAWRDVSRWRKAERERLIQQRLQMSSVEREARLPRLAALLDERIGLLNGRVVSIYWPFRGEPDLRGWASQVLERGGRIALPVVIRKASPLEFRNWKPSDPLARGIWNIPIPSEGQAVSPDIVIAPLVGFDEANYRLGYGGGYFDRTLAALPAKPLTIGVGYRESRLSTIYPQPHDIPMDAVMVS